MKKIILSILALLPALGFSQTKSDSIFIEGRYVGFVDSVKIDKSYNSITYGITLDDFVTNKEKKLIEKRYYSKSGEYNYEFTYTPRFASKTKMEIAGYYTKRAGELMNSRNNWRIKGAIVATVIFIVSPPNAAIYLVAGMVGGVSSIVSIVKDYEANKMLKNAGDVMMSK